jgi:6-phosphofructokinase 2
MAGRIVTVTLNPTIDRNYFIDHVMPDHKLRCKNPLIDPGGGGINVSKGIKELGGESLALFPLGGRTGKFLEDLLSAAGLEFQSFPIDEETRESVAVTDTSSNKQYRIVPEGPLMPVKIVDEILEACTKIKPDILVASGSLPRGLPNDVYARFAHLAKSINSKLVLDTSGDALKEAADKGAFLLKPNLGELSKLAGVEELEMDEVDAAAKEITERLVRSDGSFLRSCRCHTCNQRCKLAFQNAGS